MSEQQYAYKASTWPRPNNDSVSPVLKGDRVTSFGGEDYVFRLASANADRLGISREVEAEVLRRAHEAGLGPEVVRHVLPEGHLITRKIPATPFSDIPARYREPDVLRPQDQKGFTEAGKREDGSQ